MADFCVPKTIGLNYTCRIAKFETEAFYFTYNYTVKEPIRVYSSLSFFFRKLHLGKDCPGFFFQLPCMAPDIKISMYKTKKKGHSTCDIYRFLSTDVSKS